MKVGLIQSNFAPWRGYFDFIDDCDVFIYYDDVQYTKHDWRNRNRIKTDKGTAWITVPVLHHGLSQTISEARIDYSQDWANRILGQLQTYYHRAAGYPIHIGAFRRIISSPFETVSQLNIAVSSWVMSVLGISTPVRMSSEFSPVGTKTDRIIDIVRKAGGCAYLSGPAGRNYLEERKFFENGIRLEYKRYEYASYPQMFGPFEPQVSVLDLLFNTVRADRGFWKSTAPSDVVAAPE